MPFDPNTAQLHDDPDAGALTDWFKVNSPGASARTRKEAAEGLVAAFKGNAMPEDAARDVLRAVHKAMPSTVRQGMRKSWAKAKAAGERDVEREFWAKNVDKILTEKVTGRGSWRAQARKWMRGALDEVTRVVGLRADDPTRKAIEDALGDSKLSKERA